MYAIFHHLKFVKNRGGTTVSFDQIYLHCVWGTVLEVILVINSLFIYGVSQAYYKYIVVLGVRNENIFKIVEQPCFGFFEVFCYRYVLYI